MVAILKLAILINHSTNQALIIWFSLKGCLWTKWHRSWGFFLHDKTSASKIFARKCEILNSSRACDAKFKKTMFNNTVRENHWFYGANLKLAIMINYSTNQALLTKFWLNVCIWTKWYRSCRLSCRNEPVVINYMQTNWKFWKIAVYDIFTIFKIALRGRMLGQNYNILYYFIPTDIWPDQ